MTQRQLRPRTAEELVKDFDDRIRRLETRSEYVIGIPPNAYLLAVNGLGQLTATNTTTSTTTVIALP
ncbi:hypothetical protein [Nonomuraea sp. NEAU-A123]|uniref:hypothetical protein n=1 Tax=Nonomuraea sp. NEAU-A123 TaxID=2839649 RepID=UPI001BE4AF7F|nr:hypothetical protein [Nonomuraea sp. NEAU-A123]MBT2226240.1 hypothetical protein [Nonomuraea sp. NEAU-A123]